MVKGSSTNVIVAVALPRPLLRKLDQRRHHYARSSGFISRSRIFRLALAAWLDTAPSVDEVTPQGEVGGIAP